MTEAVPDQEFIDKALAHTRTEEEAKAVLRDYMHSNYCPIRVAAAIAPYLGDDSVHSLDYATKELMAFAHSEWCPQKVYPSIYRLCTENPLSDEDVPNLAEWMKKIPAQG